LAGAAVEGTIVATLAFNPRFQKYVQARELKASTDNDEQKRESLVQMLTPEARRRLTTLAEKCTQVLSVYRSQQAEDYILDSSREALNRLQWLYLKLLVARHHLSSTDNTETEQSLTSKIKGLEADLRQEGLPDSLRESKAATIAILKKRQDNIQRRSQMLEEIDSDCIRLEVQADLLLENASMQTKPETISSDIELASPLFGSDIFGEEEPLVSHLDRRYSPQKAQPETS
jgi:hypothetical protein